MNEQQKRTAEAIVNVFETGRVRGNYAAVTLLKGDKGHLTYGRSQTTLGSGNLFLLIKAYCDAEDAQFAPELSAFLPALEIRDFSLDTNRNLRSLLREAATDPVMCREQDAFFDRAYFNPAMKAAQNAGIQEPLGQAVVYDSFIQGGWGIVRAIVVENFGAISGTLPQRDWIGKYVDARKTWLESLDDPLPKTVYRMESFRKLIEDQKWNLELPFVAHGVEVSAAALGEDPSVTTIRASVIDSSRPILRLTQPFTTGPDVAALQQALAAQGLPNSQDGIFGQVTDQQVRQFQRSRGLKEDGIAGPQTWRELE